jgi:hypothetical protein
VNRTPACSRREFLTFGSAGAAFGWIPLFHPGHVGLAGARFRILRNGNSKRRYLLIHGDEETAREALMRNLQTHEGTGFVIENHTRHITVENGLIDPNRMFSRVGAEASLKKLNPDWNSAQIESALNLIDRGREKLVRAFFPPAGGLLVALHNNTEDYSVADEIPISDAKSIREPGRLHGFFLCTDPGDFRILATSGYNVVLQQHAPKQDDGSLSRLAAARGARYVNLEVRLGSLDRQMEMLAWLEWSLP